MFSVALALLMLPAAARAQQIGPVTCALGQIEQGPNEGYTVTTGCTITDGPATGTFCGQFDDVELRGGSGFLGCRLRANGYSVDCGRSYWRGPTLTADLETTGYGCRATGPIAAQAHCDDTTYYTPDYAHYFACKVGALNMNCKYGRNIPNTCRVWFGSAFACDLDLGHQIKSLRACAAGMSARRRA